MEEFKDPLEIIKERIKNERRRNDKSKACLKAGVSPSTYENALKKEKYSELTNGEEAALLAHIGILNERIENQRKIVSDYVNRG